MPSLSVHYRNNDRLWSIIRHEFNQELLAGNWVSIPDSLLVWSSDLFPYWDHLNGGGVSKTGRQCKHGEKLDAETQICQKTNPGCSPREFTQRNVFNAGFVIESLKARPCLRKSMMSRGAKTSDGSSSGSSPPWTFQLDDWVCFNRNLLWRFVSCCCHSDWITSFICSSCLLHGPKWTAWEFHLSLIWLRFRSPFCFVSGFHVDFNQKYFNCRGLVKSRV